MDPDDKQPRVSIEKKDAADHGSGSKKQPARGTRYSKKSLRFWLAVYFAAGVLVYALAWLIFFSDNGLY